MERLEELERALTSDEAAQERGDMALDAWSAKLREYIDLRRQGEANMTSTVKAKANVEAMRTRREAMEAEYVKAYEVLKATEDSSAERILEGADVDKEAKLIADQRFKREKLLEAIELSKEREKKATDALYQKELEQAWIDARKLWLSTFATIDKLGATVDKLTAEHVELKATHKKLIQMGGAFARTEGAGLFSPEAMIIGQASQVLELLADRWQALDKVRARYEEAYTDERRKG